MSQHSHIYFYGIAESAFPLHAFEGKVELINACYEAVEVPIYLLVGRIAAIKQGIDNALHQEVLLQARRYTSAVPVPPGIIFNSSENLFKQLMSVVPQVAEKISFFAANTVGMLRCIWQTNLPSAQPLNTPNWSR